MNPAWEFQTFGGLVERVAVPLIGLVFVFYGKEICVANGNYYLSKYYLG